MTTTKQKQTWKTTTMTTPTKMRVFPTWNFVDSTVGPTPRVFGASQDTEAQMVPPIRANRCVRVNARTYTPMYHKHLLTWICVFYTDAVEKYIWINRATKTMSKHKRLVFGTPIRLNQHSPTRCEPSINNSTAFVPYHHNYWKTNTPIMPKTDDTHMKLFAGLPWQWGLDAQKHTRNNNVPATPRRVAFTTNTKHKRIPNQPCNYNNVLSFHVVAQPKQVDTWRARCISKQIWFNFIPDV